MMHHEDMAAIAVLGAGILEISNGFPVTRTAGALVRVILIHLELGAKCIVRTVHPPKHVIHGECVRCGDCCKSIVSDPPRLLKKNPGLWLYLAYHRITHNFEWVAQGNNGEIIFSCGHLRLDNRCGIYWKRPLLCRNYPILPYYKAPTLMPQCSYQISSRVVSKMQKRSSLPIVNPVVAVYHPTPLEPDMRSNDFELIEMVPGGPLFPAQERAAKK